MGKNIKEGRRTTQRESKKKRNNKNNDTWAAGRGFLRAEEIEWASSREKGSSRRD